MNKYWSHFSKFDENYKTTDLRNSMESKNEKHEENYGAIYNKIIKKAVIKKIFKVKMFYKIINYV